MGLPVDLYLLDPPDTIIPQYDPNNSSSAELGNSKPLLDKLF